MICGSGLNDERPNFLNSLCFGNNNHVVGVLMNSDGTTDGRASKEGLLNLRTELTERHARIDAEADLLREQLTQTEVQILKADLEIKQADD